MRALLLGIVAGALGLAALVRSGVEVPDAASVRTYAIAAGVAALWGAWRAVRDTGTAATAGARAGKVDAPAPKRRKRKAAAR